MSKEVVIHTTDKKLKKCTRCNHFVCPCCGDWCDICLDGSEENLNLDCSNEMKCVFDENEDSLNYMEEREKAKQLGWNGVSEKTLEDGRVQFVNTTKLDIYI